MDIFTPQKTPVSGPTKKVVRRDTVNDALLTENTHAIGEQAKPVELIINLDSFMETNSCCEKCSKWKACPDAPEESGRRGLNLRCPCHTPSVQEKKPRCLSSPLCSHNTNGRDLDKPCSIAAPLPHTDPKEMTTELSVAILADIYRRKGIEGIGSFISKLLADERERGLKETLGSVNLKTMQEAMVEEGVAQERTRLVKIVEGMKPILWNDDPAKYKYNILNEVLAALEAPNEIS